MTMRYGDDDWKALPLRERPSFYQLAKDDLAEPSPVDADGGELIGRDPRKIPREVLAKYFPVEPGGAGNGRLVRAKCVDCSGGGSCLPALAIPDGDEPFPLFAKKPALDDGQATRVLPDRERAP
jgi:hypothetical protein